MYRSGRSDQCPLPVRPTGRCMAPRQGGARATFRPPSSVDRCRSSSPGPDGEVRHRSGDLGSAVATLAFGASVKNSGGQHDQTSMAGAPGGRRPRGRGVWRLDREHGTDSIRLGHRAQRRGPQRVGGRRPVHHLRHRQRPVGRPDERGRQRADGRGGAVPVRRHLRVRRGPHARRRPRHRPRPDQRGRPDLDGRPEAGDQVPRRHRPDRRRRRPDLPAGPERQLHVQPGHLPERLPGQGREDRRPDRGVHAQAEALDLRDHLPAGHRHREQGRDRRVVRPLSRGSRPGHPGRDQGVPGRGRRRGGRPDRRRRRGRPADGRLPQVHGRWRGAPDQGRPDRCPTRRRSRPKASSTRASTRRKSSPACAPSTRRSPPTPSTPWRPPTSTSTSSSEPVGTGPFKFVDYSSGELIEMAANEDVLRRASQHQAAVLPDHQGRPGGWPGAGRRPGRLEVLADRADLRRDQDQPGPEVRGVPGLRLLLAVLQPARGHALRGQEPAPGPVLLHGQGGHRRGRHERRRASPSTARSRRPRGPSRPRA